MPWFPAVCARLCAHHFHLQLEGERIGYTVLFTDLALQVEQLMEVMTLTDDHRGGAGCAILFPGNEVQVRCMKVGAIATAVQRRNAMTMIAGRCLAVGRAATCAAA